MKKYKILTLGWDRRESINELKLFVVVVYIVAGGGGGGGRVSTE